VQERADVPEVPRTTLVGVRVQVKPVTGEIEVESATVPVNPFRLVTVTVEVAAVPARTVAVAGLTATEKSLIVTVTVAV